MSNYFSMEAFDYDDIQLIPNKGIIKSRRDADTSVKFGNRTFKIPVVPANMESVIDDKLAVWLAENDYYYFVADTSTGNVYFAKTYEEHMELVEKYVNNS